MIRLSHPIPVYVVCRWLGAGKTTLLVRLLEHWRARGCRVGVLMNEAGDVSIDAPRAVESGGAVVNLAGGCVCCGAKDDIGWGIARLVSEYDADLIVLECSGMADPVEVVDALTEACCSHQPVSHKEINADRHTE
jgi:G3E family GTPase